MNPFILYPQIFKTPHCSSLTIITKQTQNSNSSFNCSVLSTLIKKMRVDYLFILTGTTNDDFRRYFSSKLPTVTKRRMMIISASLHGCSSSKILIVPETLLSLLIFGSAPLQQTFQTFDIWTFFPPSFKLLA